MIWSKLYPFQQQAAEFGLARLGAALFAEQGCGKTYIVGGMIERLLSPTFTALIVVPLSNIATTWEKLIENELPTLGWTSDWETFKKAKGPRVLLLHYEGVHALIKKLRGIPWDLIVYDESQRLKGRGTKQSRDAAKFVSAKHRVLLSGTPIEQCPQDLWAQFRFALPEVFGKRWSDFDNAWLKPVGFMGYQREFRWNRLPKFLKLIEPHILRLTKEQVLDLPVLKFIPAPVHLLGEQARIYADLENDFYTTVNGRDVVADMVMTQLIRLQQVCGGFVRTDPRLDESKGKIVFFGSAKLRKLVAIFNREQQPIVVFCKYLEEIAQIVRTFDGTCSLGIITGATRKTRAQTVESFQRGEIDLLICQVRTGGVGVDLFRASVGIFYSTTYSSIDFSQAVSRLHRHGQTKEVRIYNIYGRNTVDEVIVRRILSKQLVIKQVLKETKTMAKLEKAKKEAPAEKPVKEAVEKMKYGVAELAEALDLKAASVRVRLRNAEVAKAGKSYGWNTQKEFNEVVKSLKAAKKEEEAEEDAA